MGSWQTFHHSNSLPRPGYLAKGDSTIMLHKDQLQGTTLRLLVAHERVFWKLYMCTTMLSGSSWDNNWIITLDRLLEPLPSWRPFRAWRPWKDQTGWTEMQRQILVLNTGHFSEAKHVTLIHNVCTRIHTCSWNSGHLKGGAALWFSDSPLFLWFQLVTPSVSLA